MRSATNIPSLRGRIRTIALATTIALGTLLPSMSAVNAQDSGFSVSGTEELTGLTAVVTGSDNGLRLRSEAAFDADIIDTLLDGTVVTLRIDVLDTVLDPDGTTRWWPVSGNGSDGWVSGFYLSATGVVDESDTSDTATPDMSVAAETTGVDDTSGTDESFSFDGAALVDASAKIDGAGGSVNLRAAPSSDAELVTTLTDGSVVDLRIDSLDTVVDGDIRWWPISIAGFDGWVSGEFLTASDGAVAASDVAGDEPVAAFAAGSYVETFTGDGDGIIVRASADPTGDVLTILGEGTVVQIMEGPVTFTASATGWFKITTGDVTGFVDGDLLRTAEQPVSDSAPATELAFVAGDYATVVTETMAGARIRSKGSPESERIGFIPENGLVQIVSGPASYEISDRGWFEVTFEGTTGFVDGDLLVEAAAPVVETPVPETPVVETPAPTTNGAFTGGDSVVADSQTGVGVNVRTMPGIESERVGFYDDQTMLTVVEGPSQDSDLAAWYKVTNGDLEGWVAGEFLQRADDASAPQDPAETPVVEEAAPRFIAPVAEYRVSQNFGCSNLGYYSFDAAFGCNIHDGIDLASTSGTPLLASADGTVVFSGWCDCGLGYYVEIDHGDGLHTIYGHMESQPPVAVGQVVSQGDVIGPLGSTGLSTGPHVHFMFRVDGQVVNPRDYVDFD